MTGNLPLQSIILHIVSANGYMDGGKIEYLHKLVAVSASNGSKVLGFALSAYSHTLREAWKPLGAWQLLNPPAQWRTQMRQHVWKETFGAIPLSCLWTVTNLIQIYKELIQD